MAPSDKKSEKPDYRVMIITDYLSGMDARQIVAYNAVMDQLKSDYWSGEGVHREIKATFETHLASEKDESKARAKTLQEYCVGPSAFFDPEAPIKNFLEIMQMLSVSLF